MRNAKKNITDWKGCWIGESWQNDIASQYNTFFAFRNCYILEQTPLGAWMDISADARYKLWINGKFVSRGPARSLPWHQSYDRLDIGTFLQEGENWIAVLVHQFGSSNYQYLHRLRTGLIVDGQVTFENGQVYDIVTDTSWQVKRAFWYGESSVRKTLCLGFQEVCDLTHEELSWQFPPTNHEPWPGAYYLGHAGINPWSDMEQRGIPQLTEKTVSGRVIAYGVLKQVLDFKRYKNIRFAVEDALSVVSFVFGENLLKVEEEGWIVVPGASNGAQIIIVDYGQIIASYPRIAIWDAGESLTIKSAYSITAAENGIPILNDGFGTVNEGVADEVVFPAGSAEWEAFSVIGYQYHIVLIETHHAVKLRITANRTHYPVSTDPGLFFSNDVLKKIVEISDNTLKTVMLDAYTDNSWREQAQWIQDGVSMAKSVFYLYGDTQLLRRGLNQWGQMQLSNGLLNSVAPQELTFMQLTDYSLVWIEGLHFYYMQTADLEFVKGLVPVIEGLSSAIFSGLTVEHLFISPEDYQLLIDWTEIERRPYTLSLNLLVLSALEKSNELLRAAGSLQLADRCLGTARIIRSICSERFWDESSSVWREWIQPDQVIWQQYNNQVQPGGWANISRLSDIRCSRSQHGNAMALLLKLGSKDQQAGAVDYLVRSFTANGIETNYLSPMWVDKVFEALAEFADDYAFFAALYACFSREITETRTTWPEQFRLDAGSDSSIPACGNSGQGAASSIIYILYKYILGIFPEKPGWGVCILDIKSGTLKKAGGTVRTKQGIIEIEWEKQPAGNTLLVTLKLPEGVVCHVEKNSRTLESGSHIFEIST
jgi:alpha-L-rhamnosidase